MALRNSHLQHTLRAQPYMATLFLPQTTNLTRILKFPNHRQPIIHSSIAFRSLAHDHSTVHRPILPSPGHSNPITRAITLPHTINRFNQIQPRTAIHLFRILLPHRREIMEPTVERHQQVIQAHNLQIILPACLIGLSTHKVMAIIKVHHLSIRIIRQLLLHLHSLLAAMLSLPIVLHRRPLSSDPPTRLLRTLDSALPSHTRI